MEAEFIILNWIIRMNCSMYLYEINLIVYFGRVYYTFRKNIFAPPHLCTAVTVRAGDDDHTLNFKESPRWDERTKRYITKCHNVILGSESKFEAFIKDFEWMLVSKEKSPVFQTL